MHVIKIKLDYPCRLYYMRDIFTNLEWQFRVRHLPYVHSLPKKLPVHSLLSTTQRVVSAVTMFDNTKCTVYLLLTYLLTSCVCMYNPVKNDEKCKGSHEHYLLCGTACQVTCDDFMYEMECDQPCVRGCFCEEGYVRNMKYKCVKQEHCFLDSIPTPECFLPNEVYMVCGTECPDTCDNYRIQHTCARKCVSGCFCEAGYVRDDIGFCILPKDCPPAGIITPPKPTCKKGNETYSMCGSMCPETCDNYMDTPTCRKKCIPGCFCNKGYVRDYKDNCVLPEDCPDKAPAIIVDPASSCNLPYEQYLTCGSACPKTCSNFNETFFCSMDCVEGCFCRTGYVRDHKQRCIPMEYCPRTEDVKCRYMEQPATPDRPCSGSCNDPTRCIPGEDLNHCVCTVDTVRDDYGQCVFMEFCPVGCKDPNEVFDCGSPCDTECKRLGKKCWITEYECTAQCYCRHGYARDHRYKCVPIKYCPRRTPIMEIFYKKTKYMPT